MHDEQIKPLQIAAAQFAALTSSSKFGRSAQHFLITCQSVTALSTFLASTQREIDGVTELEDDEILRDLCANANIPYESLSRFDEPGETDRQQRSLRNVELGDLGELLGALSLVAHAAVEPMNIHPKNLLKPNHKTSITGIDLLIVELADDTRSDQLAPNDRITLVEAKASEHDGPSQLLKRATTSANSVSVVRLKNELRVLKRILRLRGASESQIERSRFFIAELPKQRQGLASHLGQTALLATAGAQSPEFPTACEESQFDTIVLMDVDITALTNAAYRHRRTT